MDNKITIDVEANGLSKVKEEIEELGDALELFPPNVTIKYSKNCTFNIYPSQTLIKDSPTYEIGSERNEY